jgi:hypothetical protein
MKHRRLTCVSLLGAPAALPAGVLFYVYISVLPLLLRPFLPAQAPMSLPAGAENHTYFTL